MKNPRTGLLYIKRLWTVSFSTGKTNMTICYNRLWKLLIDKGMKKKDLQRVSGISSASVTKLAKNENVNTEILQKICIALKCDICDIMEMMDEKSLQQEER